MLIPWEAGFPEMAIMYNLSLQATPFSDELGIECSAGDPGSIPRLERSAGEGIGYPLQYSWSSLVAQLIKNPPAMWETGFDPWVGKITWRRERLPMPAFLPGESGLGCKESELSQFHFGREYKRFFPITRFFFFFLTVSSSFFFFFIYFYQLEANYNIVVVFVIH